ncbi:hypothetical protein [Deinococcus navajonensis]|uniref:Cytochrome c oxidase subunit IIa family protein n=1 Tax=Deinococcus navajonensis TaxID=309884 RepID=A0ABV8XNU1_9DEIO
MSHRVPVDSPVNREPDEAPAEHQRHVVPIGTLMVVATVVLSIIWLWTLVLGIQQGRS